MSLSLLDAKILLDFLKIPNDASLNECDPTAILTSLETLSDMCSSADTANVIRDLGGVKLIWNLCCNTQRMSITHSCFFALACIAQNNIYAQQDLTADHVFSSLEFLLNSKETSCKTKTLATYLLLALVSNNKQGQNLIFRSGCLNSLTNLFTNCSQNLNKSVNDKDNIELCKILTKALSYSISVPKNSENQEKMSEILPWIVNGIHSSKVDLSIACLSCELLAVVVEENESNQQQALHCRASEALILLINSLLPNKDDKCLGSAIVALSEILTTASTCQLNLFLTYGGSRILFQLMAKELSDHWVVLHVNQTITLLLKCFNTAKEKFNAKYFHSTSQYLIKLMKQIPSDEYFQKISVQILSLILESTPLPLPAPSLSQTCKTMKNAPKKLVNTDNCRTRLLKHIPKFRKDFIGETSKNSSDENMSLFPEKAISHPKNSRDILPFKTHQAYTTILMRRQRNGKKELTLDISKSSKAALRFSSGINESPTDNIFPHPPDISAISTDTIDRKTKHPLFKRPNLRQRNLRNQRPSMLHLFNVEKNNFRYSTPKPQNLISRSYKVKGEPEQTCSSICDDSDILSICDDLIDREVMNSVKKQRNLINRGNSGLLGKKLFY